MHRLTPQWAMQFEISPEERTLLVRLLEHVVAETRVEVRRTTTPDFHDRLRMEGEQLAGLLERMRGLGRS